MHRRVSIATLLLWFVVHCTVWIGLILVIPGNDRVDYVDLGAVGTPWIRQFVIPLLAVLALQVVLVSRLGWWRPVLRDEEPSRRRGRAWIAPAIILFLGLGRFLDDGFASEAGASFLVGVALTMLLVGLTEELTFRGILLVGARGALGSERSAFLFSSAMFGLFHLPNMFIGAGVGAALFQVVQTAVIGSALYSLRRASGGLVACVALHAVYDFFLIQGAGL
jgi:membrane protease YdiL (CAAX protease family)